MGRFMHCTHQKLDNIIAIIDRNRLQIDGCTENVKGLDPLPEKSKPSIGMFWK